MTPETPNAGESVSVYLDAELAARLRTAEKDLEGKGYSRSEILAASIGEGLPAVVTKFKRRKAKISFTDAIVQMIDGFGVDLEFTSTEVNALLKANFAPLVRKYEDRDLAANVLTVLRRLQERDKIELVGTREADGPKALRKYEVNVYRRKEEPKDE